MIAAFNAIEETVKAAERFRETVARQAKLGPVRTGYLKPSVKPVKGFDSNAQKAEHKRAKRAKQHTKRQAKALRLTRP